MPMFLHHDPRTQKDREHFERAADRVRTLLSGSRGRVLLPNLSHASDHVLEDFTSLAGYLSGAAPEAALVAFIVEPPAGGAFPEIEVARQVGEHTAYRMRPVDQLLPEGFPNMLDEIALMRVLHFGRSFDLKGL